MKLLVLDTETTGLDTKTCKVCEVGYAVFDTKHRAVIEAHSTLCHIESIPAEVTRINGITAAMTEGCRAYSEVYPEIVSVAQDCFAAVAHNAEFDEGFAGNLGIPWVCSWKDLDLGVKPGALSHMALDMGLASVGLHRALADVLLLCAMLARVSNLEEQVKRIVLVPAVTLVANIPYEKRDAAKQAGFRWDAGSKKWTRAVRMGVDELSAYRKGLTFGVEVVR